MNATHPTGEECPAGTRPCSNYTTGMNTVCLPTDKLPTECPIVDIQLLTGAEGFENYTKTDYADLILAFTKD